MRKSRFFSFKSIILLCGVFFFFSYGLLIPEGQRPAAFGGGTGGAYAVLAVDEGENDRQVREALAGIGDFISESSQEILMDDFGSLKKVPLDRYSSEVEAFDPRDDGYAAKLRAFFVQGGKRFFFLPLDSVNSGAFFPGSFIHGSFLPGSFFHGGFLSNGFLRFKAAKLEKEAAALLGPHSFTVLYQRGAQVLPLIIFAASCGAALYFSRSRRLFVYALPALLAFGWSASAFAPAGLLAGIWELLREPMEELSAARRYKRRFAAVRIDYAGSGLGGLLERLKPFRMNIALALFFAVLYAAFSVSQGFPALPAALGFAGFLSFCFLAIRVVEKQAREREHILFIPVLLPPYRAKTFSLAPVLLPFCSGALLALVLPPLLDAPAAAPYQPNGIGHLVSADDYLRHEVFQQSFSYNSLNESFPQTPEGGTGINAGALMREDYLRYYLGEDGLIGTREPGGNSGDGPDARASEAGGGGMARFPLEELMDFLVQYYGGRPSGAFMNEPGHPHAIQEEEIIMALLFAVCIVDAVGPGKIGRKKKKVEEYREKRIAA